VAADHEWAFVEQSRGVRSERRVVRDLCLRVSAWVRISSSIPFRVCGLTGDGDSFSFDDGYITWVNDAKKTWTLYASALAPDSATEIGQRLIPVEPMVRSIAVRERI
jgi:Beta-glucan synthesis-associated protein SKN1/KRE6/Sbg1